MELHINPTQVCLDALHVHRSFANWCGPCLLLATELEKVGEMGCLRTRGFTFSIPAAAWKAAGTPDQEVYNLWVAGLLLHFAYGINPGANSTVFPIHLDLDVSPCHCALLCCVCTPIITYA